MAPVTNEMLRKFSDELDTATLRVGGGKLQMDMGVVRTAVRDHRETAYRFVEIHCVMAASQPGYLQPAFIIASAYEAEFRDPALVNMVNERADELNAGAHLQAIGVANVPAAQQSPERQAARDWWQTVALAEAHCDSCQAALPRGEGFLIEGRVVSVGATKINLGKELLCAACFEVLRNDVRDPNPQGDDYFSIG